MGLDADPWKDRIDYTLLWDLRNMCARVTREARRVKCGQIAEQYWGAVHQFGWIG